MIDAAAREAGETRSSFLRRAALAEARRPRRPIDGLRVAGHSSGCYALEAPDWGRRCSMSQPTPPSRSNGSFRTRPKTVSAHVTLRLTSLHGRPHPRKPPELLSSPD